MNEVSSSGVRWRPVPVISGLVLVALGIIWGIGDWTQHSVKILVSAYTLIGGAVLLLLWFLFFSRIRPKIRLVGLGGLTVLGIFLYLAVDVREVSGDVMPILAWSWTPKADEGLANTSVTATEDSRVTASSGHDYPRFLGAESTGIVTNLDLARDWEARPPAEQWRIPVGAAWSGFAVKGDLAVTQEQRGEMEMVTCYALKTGELLWAHGDPQRFATTVGGDGPRATPTIAGDRVYTMGALGMVNCLELTTGRLIWQRNVAEENKAKAPRWGYSSSPLVITLPDQSGNDETDDGSQTTRELVVVSPGGADGRSLVAYHAADGTFAWAGGSVGPGYSSPYLTTLADTEMILIFNNGSVAGHSPRDGQVLWEVPWPGGKPCVANPRRLPGDRVLVSTGYGIGCKMYQVTREGETFTPELLYESPRLKAKFANFVLHGDYAYGLDDGVMTCIETDTGQRVWKKGRYGHGQLMLVGELLLVQTEDGELLLLAADPEAHQSLATVPVLGGKSWNTFALAGNRLLMRNHQEAVCLELPLQ